MYIAAQNGHVEVIQALLTAGTNKDAPNKVRSGGCKSASAACSYLDGGISCRPVQGAAALLAIKRSGIVSFEHTCTEDCNAVIRLATHAS